MLRKNIQNTHGLAEKMPEAPRITVCHVDPVAVKVTNLAMKRGDRGDKVSTIAVPSGKDAAYAD